jgi:hypothetical protein
MKEEDPRRNRGLRGLRGASSAPVDRTDRIVRNREGNDPSIEELDRALASLEDKLSGRDGIDGLAQWLRDVEATVTALRNADLDRTRDDIRGVIDRLLSVNAEIQDIVRLKKLLS